MLIQNFRQSLFRVDQVREIDAHAIRAGKIAGIELMRRAAFAAFSCLRKRWPQARRLTIVAGPGNNGGDAFLIAVLAKAEGLAVELVASSEQSRGDAETARGNWRDAGGSIRLAQIDAVLPSADVIVDGLFGTGISRAPAGVDALLIERMQQATGRRLSLDVPSGLDADTGFAPGVALKADATISFVAWKRGLFTADGMDCCGELELDTLAIPYSSYAGRDADARLLGIELFNQFPVRKRNVNKGCFGHVLVVGGESGMAGAPRLAAEASLRAGAGLVSVATRLAHVAPINASRPEIMAHGVDDPQMLDALIERASVLAVGPGLGVRGWGHALWDRAVHGGKPMVLDADGLNLLASHASSDMQISVITPHPGEAARLLGCDVVEIQKDRFASVRRLAEKFDCVAVLKGAGTLVADPRGQVALCPFGNPGMASAGMGDLLTGVIAGLLAQGMSPWDSACLGVLAHAVSGDRAAQGRPRGLLASDLLLPLRDCVNGAVACAHE